MQEESFCDEIMIDIQMKINGKVDGNVACVWMEILTLLVPKVCGCYSVRVICSPASTTCIYITKSCDTLANL